MSYSYPLSTKGTATPRALPHHFRHWAGGGGVDLGVLHVSASATTEDGRRFVLVDLPDRTHDLLGNQRKGGLVSGLGYTSPSELVVAALRRYLARTCAEHAALPSDAGEPT